MLFLEDFFLNDPNKGRLFRFEDDRLLMSLLPYRLANYDLMRGLADYLDRTDLSLESSLYLDIIDILLPLKRRFLADMVFLFIFKSD